VDVAPNAPPSVTNTATISGGGDVNATNNAAADVVSIDPGPDLTVAKTHVGNFTQGQTGAQFTVTVSNSGGSPTSGAVSLTDSVPTGLVPTAAAGSGWTCAITGAVVDCSRSDALAAGASYPPITLTVDVASNAPASVTNVATVAGGGEVDTTNNSATDVVTIAAGTADLAITKTSVQPSAVPGATIGYTTTVTNLGQATATSVVVSDPTPTGLTFGSNAGDCLTPFPCALGDLAPGATRTITSTFSVPPDFPTSSPLANTASVTSATPDPATANNTATASTPIVPTADLAIVKAGPATAPPGAQAVYTITVTSAGPSTAAGVTVADITPAGLTFVSNAGDCVTAFPCTLGDLPPGATRAITATFTVLSTAPGSIVNTASVGSSASDPAPADNTATVTTTVENVADVAVRIASSTPTPQVGDELTIVITAANTSQQALAAAAVLVSLPPRLTLKQAVPSQGTFDPSSRSWDVGSLATGASATLDVIVIVADGGPKVIQAALQAATPVDIDPTNDVAQVTFNIYQPTQTAADLEVRIEGSPLAAPGGSARYAIRGVNYGSTNALDEAIAVTTPSGTSFQAVTASSGGVCTAPAAGQTGQVRCVWSGQTLIGSESARDVVLDLLVDAGAAAGTVVPVTAFISNLTDDPALFNNAATALTEVTTDPAADLEVTGAFLPSGLASTTADRDHPTVSMRFQVRNRGTIPVTSARLQATLTTPDGLPALLVTGATQSQGTIDAANAAWDVGALAPGAAATIDVTATVTRAVNLRIDLRRVRSAPADGTAGNDQATLVIDVVPPNGGGRYIALGNTDGGSTGELLVGGGEYETPNIQIYSAAGTLETSFFAYDPRFGGGVRLALCDVDRDGRDEIVTAAGYPGGGPHVRIFTRRAGGVTETHSWYTADAGYRGGVYVA
jgi:uncharacterized repeat protein (TIGR01451 family)